MPTATAPEASPADTDRRTTRLWFWAGSAGLLAFALAVVVFWGTARSASPDSAYYVDAARNMAKGVGFKTSAVSFSATSYRSITDWPCGFPLLIAAGIGLGFSWLASAALVLAKSYVWFVLFCYWLFLVAGGRETRPLAVALAVAAALNFWVLESASKIWSDLPFAAVGTGALLLCLWLVCRKEDRWPAWVGAGLALGLTVVVRYAGLYLLAGVVVGIAMAGPIPELKARARRAGLLVAGAMVPVAILLIRNWLLVGKLFGVRKTTRGSLTTALPAAFRGVRSLFLGNATLVARSQPASFAYRVLIAVALFTLLVLAIRVALRGAPLVRFLLAVGAIYSTGLVVSWVLAPFDPLSVQRFWLLLWPIAGGLAVGVCHDFSSRMKDARIAPIVLGGLVALVLVFYVVDFAVSLPTASKRKYWLSKSWENSVAIRGIVDSRDKNLFVVAEDPRRLIMYYDGGLVHSFPTDDVEIGKKIARGVKVRVVLFAPASAAPLVQRKSRETSQRVLALQAEGVLKSAANDEFGSVWVPARTGETGPFMLTPPVHTEVPPR